MHDSRRRKGKILSENPYFITKRDSWYRLKRINNRACESDQAFSTSRVSNKRGYQRILSTVLSSDHRVLALALPWRACLRGHERSAWTPRVANEPWYVAFINLHVFQLFLDGGNLAPAVAAPTFTASVRARASDRFIRRHGTARQLQPAFDPASVSESRRGSVWLTENLDFRFIWSLAALTRIYGRRGGQRETLIRCQILLRPRSATVR